MRKCLGFMGFAAFVGLCFAGGCRKEEPTPATAAKPKTKVTAKSGPAKAPKPPATPPAPTTTQAPASPATKAAGPARGPLRVGETREGETPTAQAAPSKKPQQAKRGPLKVGQTKRPTPAANAPKPAKPAPSKTARARREWKRPPAPDQLFYCTNCNASFIVPGEQAREQIGQAYRKNRGKRPTITCTQCGKVAATPAMKCERCGGFIIGPEEYPKGRRGPFPDKFYDECKKCGFSKMRDGMIKRLKKAMKQGRFDPNEARGLPKQAIEDAKARGEW